MAAADQVIRYLTETYRPLGIILYGSFADGSANENSDFDALVITEDVKKKHDASVIGNTVLDVFLYPPETFQKEYDPEEFLQVFDGKIVLDRDGTAEKLKQRVLDHIAQTPKKTEEEIRQAISWCEKMVSRTLREDAEGFFRWHWVLYDSLEIYCDIKGLFYHGPKKALRQMEKSDPEAFRIYSRALMELDRAALVEWIGTLKQMSGMA